MYLKMGFVLVAVLTLVGYSTVTAFDDIPDLNQIIKHTNFKLFLPEDSDKEWTIEVKDPTKISPGQSIQSIQFNFFDKSGSFRFLIKQHKSTDFIEQREITDIDVQNNMVTTRTIKEKFEFSSEGESINLSGYTARFERWADGTTGGILRWIQNDTYIEIDSKTLTKDDMISIAKSMREN
ncbi:DUF4367 domain-containing protein [Bacillus subtilis]